MEHKWIKGMLILGLTFLIAVWAIKPIGVSTQFVIFDGILWNAVSTEITQPSETSKSGYESTNAYLNKSVGKYAKSVEEPINYSFLFVVSMMVGAFISSRLRGGQSREENAVPAVHKERFDSTPLKRYLIVFISGFLVLYGARLAGGCTSGHMMSGMMQTALSGYLFAVGAFATALPVAIFTYNKKGK